MNMDRMRELAWALKLANAIMDWQNDPRRHSLTCGNDSRHLPLVPAVGNRRVLLLCPECDYMQEASTVRHLFPEAMPQ